MGAEGGRLAHEGPSGDSGGGGHETARFQPVNFPNICRREWEAPAWTLLHQCSLDKWKDGHAGQQHQHHYHHHFFNKKHLKNVGPIRYCEPFYIVIHQVLLLPPLLHATCASMSTATTTTRDRGDRYGPMEWAQ